MDASAEEYAPDAPAWDVVECTISDRNTNSELIAMCNDRRFVVTVAAEDLSSSAAAKEKYLFFLEVARNIELDGYTVEDLQDWIAEPLLPIFRDLPVTTTDPTLHSFFYPQTYKYKLKADEDTVVAVPFEGDVDTGPIFGVQIPEAVCRDWPLHQPREVQICTDLQLPGPPSLIPSKVRLRDGSVAFLKLCKAGDRRQHVNEVETYGKIRAAGLDNTLRTSCLLGLVGEADGRVLGLLLTYIDCDRRTLHCASKEGTPAHLKKKWASQVTDAVTQLHKAGVIWGDVKPGNVLVDKNEDAWLIDFGGGYTEGWVPKEVAGSVDGDVKGLENIVDYIK